MHGNNALKHIAVGEGSSMFGAETKSWVNPSEMVAAADVELPPGFTDKYDKDKGGAMQDHQLHSEPRGAELLQLSYYRGVSTTAHVSLSFREIRQLVSMPPDSMVWFACSLIILTAPDDEFELCTPEARQSRVRVRARTDWQFEIRTKLHSLRFWRTDRSRGQCALRPADLPDIVFVLLINGMIFSNGILISPFLAMVRKPSVSDSKMLSKNTLSFISALASPIQTPAGRTTVARRPVILQCRTPLTGSRFVWTRQLDARAVLDSAMGSICRMCHLAFLCASDLVERPALF